MDCSLPGSSVHGILQARILEWIAMPSSRGSSWPRDQPRSPTLQAAEPPGKAKDKRINKQSSTFSLLLSPVSPPLGHPGVRRRTPEGAAGAVWTAEDGAAQGANLFEQNQLWLRCDLHCRQSHLAQLMEGSHRPRVNRPPVCYPPFRDRGSRPELALGCRVCTRAGSSQPHAAPPHSPRRNEMVPSQWG